MENNVNEILSKYRCEVVERLDSNNLEKIVDYLKSINCNIIDDMIEDYLDVFAIDYDEFVNIIDKLNKKYDNKFFLLAESNLNYLEEIYTINSN